MLDTDTSPPGRPDQVAAHSIGNARQGNELVHWLAATEVIEGQCQPPLDQSVDLQLPRFRADRRRRSVDIDAIVLAQRREFESRAWCRCDRSTGIRQGMIG